MRAGKRPHGLTFGFKISRRHQNESRHKSGREHFAQFSGYETAKRVANLGALVAQTNVLLQMQFKKLLLRWCV